MIRDIAIAPEATVRQLLELTEEEHAISGVPVVRGNDLLGMADLQDVRFEPDLETKVSEIMTPEEKLVTVPEDAAEDVVRDLLHRHRIEKVLVTNGAFELRGLITVKDINKAQMYPRACKDSQGRLRVLALAWAPPPTRKRGSRRWWKRAWMSLWWTRPTAIPKACSIGCSG